MSNRYLDKVASFAEKRRMARAAVDIAANNPMTTAFGAGGALDGALSTTAEHGEGDVRVALRGVRNTIVGGAKGAAAGKALELGYQHLKRRAAEDPNRFIKHATLIGLSRKALDSWRDTPITTKVSLGIGATGLGVSVANYLTNRRRDHYQAQQTELNQRSLNALNRIHTAIKKSNT